MQSLPAALSGSLPAGRNVTRATVLLAVLAIVMGTALGVAPHAHAQGDFDRFLERIAGPDRFATAAALALDRGPVPEGIVLARGDSPFDALGASSLGASILLTTTDVLPDVTRDALVTLDPLNVRIVGGTGAVSSDVEAAVRAALPAAAVDRLAGPDRYATALEIAGELDRSIGVDPDRRGRRVAVLATGAGFADALAVGTLACSARWPVLLTEPGALPDSTRAALQARSPLGDRLVERVVLLGGTSAISAAVEADIAGLGLDIERVSGFDRWATAERIADLGLDEGVLTPRRAVVVRGDAPWDALGAGSYGCGGPMILTPPTSVPPLTEVLARDLADAITSGRVVGGTAAVSTAVRDRIAALGSDLSNAIRGNATAMPEITSVEQGDDPNTLFVGYDQPVAPNVVEPLVVVDAGGDVIAQAVDVNATGDSGVEALMARPLGAPAGPLVEVGARLQDSGGFVVAAGSTGASVPVVMPLDAPDDPAVRASTALADLTSAVQFFDPISSTEVLDLTFDEPPPGPVVVPGFSVRLHGTSLDTSFASLGGAVSCEARAGQPAVYRCALDTIEPANAARLAVTTRVSFVETGFSLGAVALQLAET